MYLLSRKPGFLIVLALILIWTAAGCLAAQEPPLVDGDCSEYPGLGATRVSMSADVELYIYQDRYYVWLCYTYPEGSFGTADLKLKTQTLPSALNLHISAQLGEWPADKPELSPKDPESDLWWNVKGWTANTVWINGMDRSGAKPRYRFKNARAREIQLGKRRFGRGDWSFSLEIHSIKAADGKLYNVTFPKAGGSYTLKVT